MSAVKGVALLVVLALVGCPGNTKPGALCRSHKDCASLKDGWCAKVEVCTQACDTVACPDDSTCVTEGTRRVCLASCSKPADCLPNFSCNEKPEGSVCEFATPFGKPPP